MKEVETQEKARDVKGIPMCPKHAGLFREKFLESQEGLDFWTKKLHHSDYFGYFLENRMLPTYVPVNYQHTHYWAILHFSS